MPSNSGKQLYILGLFVPINPRKLKFAHKVFETFRLKSNILQVDKE